MIFVTPGKGKQCLAKFRRFPHENEGRHQNIAEMVCDMSPAFLAAIAKSFPSANVTVDWSHVVQVFTTAVDEVGKTEAEQHHLPKATDVGRLTIKQQKAIHELESGGFATATAWKLKEMLIWVKKASTSRAAQWRITHFCRHALKSIAYDLQKLDLVLKALPPWSDKPHKSSAGEHRHEKGLSVPNDDRGLGQSQGTQLPAIQYPEGGFFFVSAFREALQVAPQRLNFNADQGSQLMGMDFISVLKDAEIGFPWTGRGALDKIF